MASMSPIAALAALIAALLHVGFFYFESIVWSRPNVWARFHVASQADAEIIRPMALNQGFYNLFLGLGIVAGLVLSPPGRSRPGPRSSCSPVSAWCSRVSCCSRPTAGS